MKIGLFVIFFSMLGLNAFASPHSPKDLALLKQGCSDPGSVQNQNPPSEITINCSGNKNVWVMTMTNPAVLQGSMSVSTSATTDKPNVGSEETTTDLAVVPVNAGCPVYTEANFQGAMSFSVTCEEVMAMNDLTVWCGEKLAIEGQNNPSLWTIVATGNVYEPCVAVTPVPVPTPLPAPATPTAF